MTRPFANALELLRAARLRPTRQRLALARLLFEKGDRHVAAEELHGEALAAQIPVSLATVYNTLHQFVGAGFAVSNVPPPPEGGSIRRVDVIVRIEKAAQK